MNVIRICFILLIVISLLMMFVPEKCVWADKKGDADAIKEVADLGKKFLAFTALAMFLYFKYKIF